MQRGRGSCIGASLRCSHLGVFGHMPYSLLPIPCVSLVSGTWFQSQRDRWLQNYRLLNMRQARVRTDHTAKSRCNCNLVHLYVVFFYFNSAQNAHLSNALPSKIKLAYDTHWSGACAPNPSRWDRGHQIHGILCKRFALTVKTTGDEAFSTMHVDISG